jgi:hypothetical protein
MGMDQTVTFRGPTLPTWEIVRDLLVRCGFPVQTRMIDGELAFPEEAPPETWRELRLGTPQGMVTLRREADRIVFVTWGNADQSLREAWNALAWAYAETGGGMIQTSDGALSAASFQQKAEMPAVLR